MLAQAFEFCKGQWARMAPAARFTWVLLTAGALVAGWTVIGASGDGMVRVGGAGESDRIRARLDEKKRAYELRGDGIYVRSRDLEHVTVDLVGEGILSGDELRKALRERSFFDSSSVTDKQWQAALQQRLEGWIRRMDAIESVGVQLTPAATSKTFGAPPQEPTATVHLKLKPPGNRLSRQNVLAIAQLVAGAWSGLSPERVHIMDTQGRAYRVAASDASAQIPGALQELAAGIEERVKAKVEQLFSDRWEVRVIAGVELKSEASKSTHKQFENPQPREEERKRKVEQAPDGSGAGRIKGIERPEPPPSSSPTLQESHDRTINDMDVRVTESSQPAGQIEKITLGITVAVPASAGKEEIELIERLKPQIKKLAMAAHPRVDERSIEILALPTRAPEPPPPPSVSAKLDEIVGSAWFTPAAAGGLVVLVLFAGWLLLRRAVPRGMSSELEAFRTLAGGAAAAAAPALAAADEETARLRFGVRQGVAQDPRSAAAVVRRWLSGK